MERSCRSRFNYWYGTDAPVEIGDPRIEFYAAITRKDIDGFYADI